MNLLKVNKIEEMIKIRDGYLGLAEIITELIEVAKRDEAGEEVDEKELELLTGRLLIKMLELDSLK